MNERRLQILQQVERGEISTEQGARLLALLEDGRLPEATQAGLEGGGEVIAAAPDVDIETGADPVEQAGEWRHWKWLPFGLAVLLTVVGAIWLYQGWTARQFGIGFWLAWIPFVLGVAGMAFSWRLRWLHLRIKDKEKDGRPTVFTLHIPLPLGLAAWAMRTFGRFSPVTDPAQRDEIASILEGGLASDGPVVISVDEDDSQVELVIE